MLSSREKMISRPGKLSREKAKAARMVVMAVAATLDAVTTTELIKYFSKGAVLKALCQPRPTDKNSLGKRHRFLRFETFLFLAEKFEIAKIVKNEKPTLAAIDGGFH